MSAGCVRWVLLSRNTLQRAVCGHRTPAATASRFSIHLSEIRSDLITSSSSSSSSYQTRWSPFCTTTDATAQQTPAPKKNNKKKPDAQKEGALGAVGRNIPQRLIKVVGEEDEDMGTMHRADVLRVMNERGLKLVLLRANEDPPVYRLMSGKQIHEEQLRLREKQKAKAAQVQVKELTFSSGIASHDLTTKLKQVESWLEKKHHVRITLRSGRRDPVANLDSSLEQMVQQMEVVVGFVTKPSVIREGQAAMCVLRPPSAKELSQIEKKKTAALQADKATVTKTSSVSNTDTTEGSIQQ